MGKAVARHSKSKAERLLEAETAMRLHVSGVEDSVICRQLGISKATLKRRIRWALDQVVDPTVAEYREEAQARIRESRRRIYETLSREEPVIVEIGGSSMPLLDPETGERVMRPVCGPAEIAALTGRLRELEELEAKLRGGFAPTQVNHQHTVTDAFAVLMEEINAVQPVAERVPRV